MDGMQEETQRMSSSDMRRPLVVRALRRSKIRAKVVEYLFDISPSGSYTSEIAYHTKTTPTNVIGALRGMGSRYKKEESLLSLDIIELMQEGNEDFKLYRITEFGKEIVDLLKIGRASCRERV